jgi:hypothetical protein
VRCRLAIRLLALVALEVPLIHPLLCLAPQIAMVTIDKCLLVYLAHGPPSGANVDPAGHADLLAAL